MEEADKDWMMIRMVGGSVFLLVPALPGPKQKAVKWLLLLLFRYFLMQKPEVSYRKRQVVYILEHNNKQLVLCHEIIEYALS